MFRFRMWLVLAVLTMASLPVSAALRAVRGEAHDPASGNLLYREQHLIRSDGHVPTERLVLYRCPSGTTFARKHVDYRGFAMAPEFSLRDARRDYREGLGRTNGKPFVWSGIGKPTPQALDEADGPLVADAGFDEYLRARWDALLQGTTQPLAFVVPAYGRSMDFQVEHLGAGAIDGLPVERFRLELDGLLGLVAPKMLVEYASDDHRLRRFTGLTNLRGNNGKQLRARIDFAQPSQPATASAWQDAMTTRLSNCTLGS